VFNVGVFNSGILATDPPSASSHFAYQPAPSEVIARAGRIAEVCHRYGVRLPEAAVQFSFTDPAIRAVVIGADSPGQARQAVSLGHAEVPPELWSELARSGLLPHL
jgi:D-threo-aldose 1-dehydrogenase